MPKNSRRFIRQKYLVDCPCGYKSTNDKAMKLHMKYSHDLSVDHKKKCENYELVCGLCKKRNCKMH